MNVTIALAIVALLPPTRTTRRPGTGRRSKCSAPDGVRTIIGDRVKPRHLTATFISFMTLFIEAAPASAQGEEWGTTRPTVVEVTIAAPRQVAHETEALLRELLEPRLARLEVVHVTNVVLSQALSQRAAPDRFLAQVWIDLTGRDVCAVMIVDPSGDRALLREIGLEHGVDVVAREEVGQIVNASIEALVAGAEFGVASSIVAHRIETSASLAGLASPSSASPPSIDEPQPVDDATEPEAADPQPTPTPLPPPRPDGERRIGLDIALAYDVSVWAADQAPAHGPGAHLTIVLPRVRARPLFGLGFNYLLPATVDGTQVGAQLDQYQLSVNVGVLPVHRQRVSFGIRLGLIVDMVRLEPHQLDGGEGFALEEARVEVMALLRLSTELQIHLLRWLSLVVGVAVEFDVAQTRMTVQHTDSTEVVFEPWWVRPMFRLGFVFGAL